MNEELKQILDTISPEKKRIIQINDEIRELKKTKKKLRDASEIKVCQEKIDKLIQERDGLLNPDKIGEQDVTPEEKKRIEELMVSEKEKTKKMNELMGWKNETKETESTNESSIEELEKERVKQLAIIANADIVIADETKAAETLLAKKNKEINVKPVINESGDSVKDSQGIEPVVNVVDDEKIKILHEQLAKDTKEERLENTTESSIEKINDLRKEYVVIKEREKKLVEEYNVLVEKLEKLGGTFFKFIGNIFAYLKLESEIKEKEKEYNMIELNKMVCEEYFNTEERKLFPFAYSIIDKIKNPNVKYKITRQALKVKKGVDRTYSSLDWFNSVTNDKPLVDPIDYYNKNYDGGFELQKLDNKYNVNFNIYGFSIESINPKEITKDGNPHGEIINTENPKAKYRVIDPDGKTILDGADYNNAMQIYNEATENYKKQIEEEFNKLNIKKEEGEEEKKNKEKNKNIPVDTSLEEKQKIASSEVSLEKRDLSEVIKEFEKKAKDNLETGPLSERIRKGVLDGLTKWETFGQGEEGWKGFQHRMTKTFVNMALIGTISMLAMDQLVKNTATLGGGFASRLGMRLGFGLTIGSVVDVGGKKVSSEKLQKLMPWITGAISVAIATALSGAAAVGLAAGASAYLGYQASKLIKGKFVNEKIATKKEDALKKLYEKYRIDETVGKIDINHIPEFEKDYQKIIKHFENISIGGKLLVEVGKVALGTGVSMVAMGASGYAREHIGHNQATVENVKENEQHQNTETINKEPEIKSEPETKQENVAPEKQPEPQSQPEIKTEAPIIEHKIITVEFSSRGAIQTILDMKEAIHNQYGDISKAPESIQEFMNTPATEEAIKLGLYNPDNPNGAESAMLLRGSTFILGENDVLSVHDIGTGEDHDLISPYKEASSGEVLEKYHGKMFDSDHSEVKTEDVTQTQGLQDEIINTPHYEPTNPVIVPDVADPNNLNLNIRQEEIINTPHNETGLQGSSSDIKHVDTTNTPHTTEPLSPGEAFHQVQTIIHSNINHIFPTEKLMGEWNSMKDNVSAEKLMEMYHNKELNDDFKPLAHHIKDLERISDLHPEAETLINPAESITNFISRALEKIQEIGRLNRVKL